MAQHAGASCTEVQDQHATDEERRRTNNKETSQGAVLPPCKALAESTRTACTQHRHKVSKQDAPEPNSFTTSLIAREHCRDKSETVCMSVCAMHTERHTHISISIHIHTQIKSCTVHIQWWSHHRSGEVCSPLANIL